MVKVFIGAAANFEDVESQAVIEYTLRTKASVPVEITWMQLSRDSASPFSGWKTSQWATPFSGFRWAIPALCDYTGTAVYFDSDFIIQADIAELLDIPLNGAMVLAKSTQRTCCMVWDCARAAAVVPGLDLLRNNPDSHRQMIARLQSNPDLVQVFPGGQNWNCLDGEGYRDLSYSHIKAIHYTAMRYQPQLEYAIPRLAAQGLSHWFDGQPKPHPRADLRELFRRLLSEAVTRGYNLERYMQGPVFGPYNKRKVGGVR